MIVLQFRLTELLQNRHTPAETILNVWNILKRADFRLINALQL